MKDFEKTVAFVREFNTIGDIISRLWDNDKYHPQKIESLVGDMKMCCKATSWRGEELVAELKDVCPDIVNLKEYVTAWESILDELTTIWMDDEFFDYKLWESRVGDYFLARDIVALLRDAKANYDNVMSSAWDFKRSYGIVEHRVFVQGIGTENDTEGNPGDKPNMGGNDVPHDVLRLFGGSIKRYREYITACKDQCPKEIARLYKDYGTIQLYNEGGVVTTLYNHLSSIGLLNCTKRNFQCHYSQI